ncbi:putative exported protein [Granulibacter bethesdensis]|nr:outer membrane beta-barrel protein [Granulibacter bethesdensis]APH57410.1 putative exported protein [Granulibacter bethesdensis]
MNGKMIWRATTALCFGTVLFGLAGQGRAQVPEEPKGDEMRPTISEMPAEQQQAISAAQKPKPKVSYWDNTEAHLTIQAGITGNPWTKSGRNFGQFYADRANTVTLNQIMGNLSHPIQDVGKGYGVGFVFEMMYGSDARFDPTIGMADGVLTGLYQWVPTQAHIDFHLPWITKGGVDIQVGQMYGLLGSEGTPALLRPFYTFNYASDYIVPFEMVGVMTTTHVTDKMDFILGINAGNSTTFGNAGNNSRPKGTIGAQWNNLMDNKLNFHLLGNFGPQGNNSYPVTSPDGLFTSAGVGPRANDEMQYNVDFLASYKVNQKTTVTVDATYLHDDLLRADAYGVTTYLAYDINPNLTFNARGEVFRDNTGLIIAQYSSFTSFTRAISNKPFPYFVAPPTTYGELTLGVTYRPDFVNRHMFWGGKFTVRPEIRYDRSLNGTNPFNESAVPSAANGYFPVVNNGTNDMLWFNLDMIVNF